MPVRKNILVIDDEAGIRDVCQQVLAQAGHDVKVAVDGSQGLALAQGQSVDLVLLDYRMPGMSAMEVIAQIRHNHPETAIIMMTGYGTITLAVETMKAGACDFITKPFTPDHLRAVVSEALSHRKTRQGVAEQEYCLIDGVGIFFQCMA